MCMEVEIAVSRPSRSNPTHMPLTPVGKATGVVNPSAAVDRRRCCAILSRVLGAADASARRPRYVPRDRVVGILGHELRNPLSAIVALARVTMSREDLPGEVRERLSQMDRAAQRSLAMIESLLDFSHSRWKGALPTRPVLTDPREIAGRVIDELRAANPDRVIALDARSSAPFEMDPARMEQVLSNLIGNAIMHGSPRHAGRGLGRRGRDRSAARGQEPRAGDSGRSDRVAVPAFHSGRRAPRTDIGAPARARAWGSTSCGKSSARTTEPSRSIRTTIAARVFGSACRAG